MAAASYFVIVYEIATQCSINPKFDTKQEYSIVSLSDVVFATRDAAVRVAARHNMAQVNFLQLCELGVLPALLEHGVVTAARHTNAFQTNCLNAFLQRHDADMRAVNALYDALVEGGASRQLCYHAMAMVRELPLYREGADATRATRVSYRRPPIDKEPASAGHCM